MALPVQNKGEILLYQSEDGMIKIQVRLEDETILADTSRYSGIVSIVQIEHQ
jgi:hypothetical protein